MYETADHQIYSVCFEHSSGHLPLGVGGCNEKDVCGALWNPCILELSAFLGTVVRRTHATPGGRKEMGKEMKSNDEWMTPDWILDTLPPIDLDPCYHSASGVRASSTYDIRKGQDGLSLPWHGTVFCNPPYSRTAAWLARCRMHGTWRGCVAIALVPAVPGDGPWAREVWGHASAIGFIRGRVAFRHPGTGEEVVRGRGHALVVWGDLQSLPQHSKIIWVKLHGGAYLKTGAAPVIAAGGQKYESETDDSGSEPSQTSEERVVDETVGNQWSVCH